MSFLLITLWLIAIYSFVFVSLRVVGVRTKYALMVATALITGALSAPLKY